MTSGPHIVPLFLFIVFMIWSRGITTQKVRAVSCIYFLLWLTMQLVTSFSSEGRVDLNNAITQQRVTQVNSFLYNFIQLSSFVQTILQGCFSRMSVKLPYENQSRELCFVMGKSFTMNFICSCVFPQSSVYSVWSCSDFKSMHVWWIRTPAGTSDISDLVKKLHTKWPVRVL